MKEEMLELHVDGVTKQGVGPKAARSGSRRHTLYLGGAPGEVDKHGPSAIYPFLPLCSVKKKSLPTKGISVQLLNSDCSVCPPEGTPVPHLPVFHGCIRRLTVNGRTAELSRPLGVGGAVGTQGCPLL